MKLQGTFFEVVLLDLNFDNDTKTVLDAFRIIQALERGFDVILISAETKISRVVEMCNFGITRYIARP